MPVVLDVPFSIITHSRRVCRLYKDSLRNLLAYCKNNTVRYRYNAVLLRERFDLNKDIKDMRIAKQLVAEGEEELFLAQHPQPLRFPTSPGGPAYDREAHTPDWVLDFWDPMEKAAYPDYFARRELRKQQFIEMWNKKYGKPAENHH